MLKATALNFDALATQVMQHCDVLGAISQHPDYIDRRYLTPEHARANAQVHQWMQAVGMETWQDEGGNCWGRYVCEDANAPHVLFGSHLDTVPNGGRYDGMLGVIAPLALVYGYHQAGKRLPFNIDIVGFGDEEGTRFGSTLLGSRALTGRWPDSWAELVDENGITLPQAMQNFGLDFAQVKNAEVDPAKLLAFFELHIEQGPVLERHDLPVGVVSAISGARRLEFTIQGMAGHAGTVPMAMRHDALCASAEMILAIEHLARQNGLVATVGRIQNMPNGVNVISGKTIFTLDIRSESDQQRDNTVVKILDQLEQIAKHRNVTMSYHETHNAGAVACDTDLRKMMQLAIEQTGHESLTLSSGAGHDAMEIARICPVAMLFMRCHKGISHHPGEAIRQDDVAVALEVLHNCLEQLS